jgi:hypothetical protein
LLTSLLKRNKKSEDQTDVTVTADSIAYGKPSGGVPPYG